MLDTPPLDLIEVAAAAGFDAVGVRLGSTDPVDPVELATRARAAGVALHDLEVYRIGTDGRDRCVELLGFAAESGIPRLLVVSDLREVGPTEDELGWACAEASRFGVSVALEYMAWVTPDSSAGAARLARSTGCEVVVDALHHHRLGEGADAIGQLREAGVLGWFQLCDAPAQAPVDLIAEARGGRLSPGEGGLPLSDHVEAIGSDVAISVEVQGLEARLPDALERARTLFRAARLVIDAR